MNRFKKIIYGILFKKNKVDEPKSKLELALIDKYGNSISNFILNKGISKMKIIKIKKYYFVVDDKVYQLTGTLRKYEDNKTFVISYYRMDLDIRDSMIMVTIITPVALANLETYKTYNEATKYKEDK